MKKWNLIIQIAVSLTLASIAGLPISYAREGGANGGGGELIRDGRNPWFVKNTKTVRYCLEVDKARFPQAQLPLDEMIQKALHYWSNEFASAVPGRMYGNAGVATQNFVKQGCDESVDLRFQFGVLRPEQQQYVGSPTSYVSEVIRTSYDPVNLRGKGFIYFSPDSGPLKFKSDRAPGPVWTISEGKGKLYLVIVHELGHIFGIPHMGHFPNRVMSENFPEWIVTQGKGMYDYEYENGLIDRPFFGFKPKGQIRKIDVSEKTYGDLDPTYAAFKFFEVPKGIVYLKAHFLENKIDILAVDSATYNQRAIGVIIPEPSKEQDQYLGGLKIYLTKDQKVFGSESNYSADDWSRLGYFESVEVTQRRIPAKYKSYLSGKEHAAFVEYGPDGYRIGGEVDGVIIPELTFDYF